jgi:hypothetical protein
MQFQSARHRTHDTHPWIDVDARMSLDMKAYECAYAPSSGPIRGAIHLLLLAL